MPDEYKSTAPKPFVFVLMPFAEEFDDIYEFGIKGAADDAGAYAERVDEQMFDEGILERVFNQINKADVIVAEMTGRNPNVFYEVGYAHALGKLVVLMTKTAEDIPFDLKDRPHIEHGGRIADLKDQLTRKLTWALEEARRRGDASASQRFSVAVGSVEIPLAAEGKKPPLVNMSAAKNLVPCAITVRNESPAEKAGVEYIYLFSTSEADLVPGTLDIGGVSRPMQPKWTKMMPTDARSPYAPTGMPVQYRLQARIEELTPQAADQITLTLLLNCGSEVATAPFTLRLHTHEGVRDFPFKVMVTRERRAPRVRTMTL
jgi:hypothetical protein